MDTYIGVNRFGYYIKSLRVSMGDFDTDAYQTFSRSIAITAWIVWVLSVFILNIILMNFIIALISDAYAKVKERMDAEQFKIKAEFILERESTFSEADLTDP